ncbi:MAG: aminotransferase class V-fold PLP-dependent enzyme, partial [Nanoarchaeota archaeon]
MNIDKIRNDFPILNKKIHGKNLIYFDNSSTSQSPLSVIEAMNKFYKESRGGVHRAIHKLGEESTILYEEAHKEIAKFIGAKEDEILFTKNTTESLNLVA